ncbi:hypothetical protein [Streptomyces sp. NBC_00582]|uniref:hypothetical protein n=1 Tax=Streptomyces sp. NBC_00582 TaxID=2975783 RepID=UPI0010DA5CFF|nr:hypothetical protein [Streptomyces sp. NBC_00582]WUB64891.1 hypothetical protein OG852_33030 [Streptomyces sp. NBC_00582]
MSARESFEDRLLAELTREIALREEAVTVPGPRRLLTRRRVSLALAACAVAAAVAIAVPGSAGGSRAYAVERHGDGSVTLTIKEAGIGVEDRQALTNVLSKDDIEVVEWGPRAVPHSCVEAAGQVSVIAWDKSGRPTTIRSWRRPVVLHPGDKVTLCPSR